MSLLAHWKLDGNANDSVGNNNGTVYGNTAYVAGKISNCFSFDGSSYINITDNDTLDLSSTFTISAWIKTTSTSGIDIVSHANVSSPYYGFCFNIGQNGGSGLLSLWTSGTGGGGWTSSTTTVNDNLWHHVLVTFSGVIDASGTAIFYVDGNNVFSATKFTPSPTNNYMRIGANEGEGRRFNGLIDDVRIYNHALSQKEVKELSRAKILHYDFDDFQEPTTNLLPNPIGLDATNWAARENVTVTTGQEDPFGGTDAIRIHPLSAVDSYFGSRNDILTIGTYSTSVWLKATKDTTVVLNTGTRSDGGAYITYTASLTTYWKLFTYTGTTTAEPTHAFHVGGWNTWVDTSFDVFMAFPQLEQKDHATPFVNGSRTGTVRDISGYNNDATLALATTPQWVEGKLGSGAYYFDGTGKTITLPTSAMATGSITFWFKVPASNQDAYLYVGGGGYQYLYIGNSTGGYSDESLGFVGGAVSENYTIVFYVRKGQYYYCDNAWHHVAIVIDGIANKIYVDGVSEEIFYQLGGPTTTGLISGNINLSGTFGSGPLTGDIDDVRIYATALNSEDILELYQTRAQIDKNGNMFAIELQEADDAAIQTSSSETLPFESTFFLEDIYN